MPTPDATTLKAALVESLAYLSVLHVGTLGNAYRWTARDLATDLAPLLARALTRPETDLGASQHPWHGANPVDTSAGKETLHDH
jgi:hypothetical protein